MRPLIQRISFAVGTFAASAGSALAQSAGGGGGFFDNPYSGPPPNAVSQDTLGGTITTLINYILGILGLIAVAFVIYAGVILVTAGGDDGAIDKAKKIITYALVGIVIIMLSYTIVTFVTNALAS